MKTFHFNTELPGLVRLCLSTLIIQGDQTQKLDIIDISTLLQSLDLGTSKILIWTKDSSSKIVSPFLAMNFATSTIHRYLMLDASENKIVTLKEKKKLHKKM
jgi:hypothetical protein